MPLKLLEPGFAPASLFQFTWCTRGTGTWGYPVMPGYLPHTICALSRGIAPPALRCGSGGCTFPLAQSDALQSPAGARAACLGDISVRQGDIQQPRLPVGMVGDCSGNLHFP